MSSNEKGIVEFDVPIYSLMLGNRMQNLENLFLGNSALPKFAVNSEDSVTGMPMIKEQKEFEDTIIENGFDGIGKDENLITRGLSKEGYQVYKSVLNQLKKAQSEKARESAVYNAVLLARHADRFAETVRKIIGKEYTALDYIQNVGIEANATEVQEGRLKQEGPNTFFNMLSDKQKEDYRQAGLLLAQELDNGKLLESAFQQAPLGAQRYNAEISRNAFLRKEIEICLTPEIYKHLGLSVGDKFAIKGKDLLGVHANPGSSIAGIHHTPHDVNKAILKQIPIKLHTPLYVFDSIKYPGKVVIILDIDVKDKNNAPSKMFLPVILNKTSGQRGRGGTYNYINLAVSAYPRTINGIEQDIGEILLKNKLGDYTYKVHYCSKNTKRTVNTKAGQATLPPALVSNSSIIGNSVAQALGNVNTVKQGARGQISFYEQQSIISLFSNAD